MAPADLIGTAAATLTTVAFVPQVLHTWRSRDTAGISLGMVSLFSVGIALWLYYGILLSAWPVIIANVVTLALTACLLAMKLAFGPRTTRKSGAVSPPR